MAARPWGLLLAPGAGASRDHSQLVAIDAAAGRAGARTWRMDFAYRVAGRRAPDRQDVLVASVVSEQRSFVAGSGAPPERLFLGGRSMGGRICSLAAAEGLVAAGLVLVSYPLHPPGRPDRLRTGHFPQLGLPCLFVSGTRDAFATPGELEAEVAAIPGEVTLAWVAGGDHGLRRADDEVAEVVSAWLALQVSKWPGP